MKNYLHVSASLEGKASVTAWASSNGISVQFYPGNDGPLAGHMAISVSLDEDAARALVDTITAELLRRAA